MPTQYKIIPTQYKISPDFVPFLNGLKEVGLVIQTHENSTYEIKVTEYEPSIERGPGMPVIPAQCLAKHCNRELVHNFLHELEKTNQISEEEIRAFRRYLCVAKDIDSTLESHKEIDIAISAGIMVSLIAGIVGSCFYFFIAPMILASSFVPLILLMGVIAFAAAVATAIFVPLGLGVIACRIFSGWSLSREEKAFLILEQELENNLNALKQTSESSLNKSTNNENEKVSSHAFHSSPDANFFAPAQQNDDATPNAPNKIHYPSLSQFA